MLENTRKVAEKLESVGFTMEGEQKIPDCWSYYNAREDWRILIGPDTTLSKIDEVLQDMPKIKQMNANRLEFMHQNNVQ